MDIQRYRNSIHIRCFFFVEKEENGQKNPQIVNYQLVESSCTYDLVLDDRKHQVLNLSQGIGANEAERFQIKIASSIAEVGMGGMFCERYRFWSSKKELFEIS